MSIRKSIIELLQLFMTLSTRRVSNRPWCQSRHQSQTSEWGPKAENAFFDTRVPPLKSLFQKMEREKKENTEKRERINEIEHGSFMARSPLVKKRKLQSGGRLDEIGKTSHSLCSFHPQKRHSPVSNGPDPSGDTVRDYTCIYPKSQKCDRA